MHTRTEMLDLVLVDGCARGTITRNLVSGEIKAFAADAVVLATGGYSNVYHLSTNAKASNVTAAFRAYKRGAAMANPSFTQIHPTCIPASGEHQSKLTLMSESLRKDGRIWVPKSPDESRPIQEIPAEDRDYYLERKYPSFGNLAPRDISSRAAKEVCDEGRGVGPTKRGVYLDFADAIERHGQEAIRKRYGNLFDMYSHITSEDPYRSPMRIYPAPHYSMGGLWVDYNLMSNVPGLFVIGEANFADHGANRLGASALMQGLADGYFILPYTIGDYIARTPQSRGSADSPEFKQTETETRDRINRFLTGSGKRTATSMHRELGELMIEACGMSRSEQCLREALARIPLLREEFYQDVAVPGDAGNLNISLEYAGRVADFLEFAELMCHDALARDESCGAHFRIEHQTEQGEALRNDEAYCNVSAWEFAGVDKDPILHVEPLELETVQLAVRNYQ